MNHYNNDVDVCAQCGAMIPSGAPFCPKCGKKNTLANASNQQQNFVAYKPPIQNNVAGNYYQAPVENKPIVNCEVVGAPVPQPVQKQSKTWLVILIVFLVLVAAGIGIFFQELWSSDNHSNNNGVISSRGEYTKGYLNEMADYLTEDEVCNMGESIRVITFELALRFLNDYINGDTYFKTKYDKHNLVRTRNQLKLLSDIDKKMPEINKFILDTYKMYRNNSKQLIK